MNIHNIVLSTLQHTLLTLAHLDNSFTLSEQILNFVYISTLSHKNLCLRKPDFPSQL